MKFGNETVEVKTNASNNKNFTIDMNAKSFGILTTNLYSDPVLAVVRELCCNAWDSHKDAGTTDTPFVIMLPTYANHEFVVEDFGIGLSDEQIYEVYTTFFRSTKNNSNKVTGCLGLGSKTPFSITDSFFVESYYDGVYNKYVMFLGADGVPSITKVSTAPTERKNGLKITVPTDKISDFRCACESVLPFFPKNSFEVKNDSSDFHNKMNMTKFFDENISIINNASFSLQNDKLHVVQGHVRYPVDMSKISKKYYRRIQHIFNYDSVIVVEVPIGCLSIAPSREELHYDERTIEYLNNMVSGIFFEILRDVEYNIWNNNISDIYKYINDVKKFGKSYTNFICRNIPEFNKHFKDIQSSVRVKGDYSSAAMFIDKIACDYNYKHKDQKLDRIGTMGSLVEFMFEPNEVSKTEIFFCSKRNGYIKRLKSLYDTGYFRNSSTKNIYVVFSQNNTIEQAEQYIRNLVGFDEFSFSYNLDTVEVENSYEKKDKVTNVLLYVGNTKNLRYDSPESENWKMLTEEELSELNVEETFYVDMKRFDTKFAFEETDNFSPNSFHDFNFGINIIGIRGNAKKYKKVFNPLTFEVIEKWYRKMFNFNNVKKCVKRLQLKNSRLINSFPKKYIDTLGDSKKARIFKNVYTYANETNDDCMSDYNAFSRFKKIIKNISRVTKIEYDSKLINDYIKTNILYIKMAKYIDNQYMMIGVINFNVDEMHSDLYKTKYEKAVKSLLKSVDMM